MFSCRLCVIQDLFPRSKLCGPEPDGRKLQLEGLMSVADFKYWSARVQLGVSSLKVSQVIRCPFVYIFIHSRFPFCKSNILFSMFSDILAM